MSSRAKNSVSFAGIILVCAIAALSARTLRGSDPAGEAPAVTLPSAVEVMLMRAGINAESLAASGVSGQVLSAQLAAVGDSLTGLPAQLSAADAAYAEARARRDDLERLVQSGQGAQEDVAALVQARADLADAEAARTAVLDEAFASATEGMADEARTALGQIRSNHSWHVPVQYKVVPREQSEWIAIRDCLAHVRTYADHELDPLPEITSRLSSFDGQSAVAEAASSLETYLSGVQATWDATFVD